MLLQISPRPGMGKYLTHWEQLGMHLPTLLELKLEVMSISCFLLALFIAWNLVIGKLLFAGSR